MPLAAPTAQTSRDIAAAQQRAIALGWVPPGAHWQRLAGGRTNLLWRVAATGGDLVVKLYCRKGATPLFPNDGRSELAALRHLSRTGLAPEPLDFTDDPAGQMLLYVHVEGPTGRAEPEAAAALLGRLHRMTPPAGLRQLPSGSTALRRAAEAILSACPADAAADLRALGPGGRVPPLAAGAFLHGDPVPANIVDSTEGPLLIDWQCPAAGDPCEDLAMFLSPAMQRLYGAGPLGAAACDRFLAAYPDQQIARRYRALAPHFHWRMAAYCLWRARLRGDCAYGAALADELAALERTGHRPQGIEHEQSADS